MYPQLSTFLTVEGTMPMHLVVGKQQLMNTPTMLNLIDQLEGSYFDRALVLKKVINTETLPTHIGQLPFTFDLHLFTLF